MIDFLVIGGGVAGLSAAARLSDHGVTTVLEAEDALGYHASGRSAALYEASYGLPSTVALNEASAVYHQTANGGYLTPRGLLVVAAADHFAAFERDLSDLNLDEIDPTLACRKVPILNPDVVRRAGYHNAAWDIDTDRLLQDFARRVRQNSGTVAVTSKVHDIRRTARGWDVDAGAHSYETRVLVNAAGAWADAVAGLAGIVPLGIVPHRRSMARLPAPGGHDLREWPMVMGAGESWYAKPDAGKLLVSPAEEHRTEPHDAYADDIVLAGGLARYQAMVTEPVTRVETNWAGLRSFAPDRALVLGPDPSDPAFVWCAGQGGYGFQTAPAASQLLCDLVVGATPDLSAEVVTALRPDRLR